MIQSCIHSQQSLDSLSFLEDSDALCLPKTKQQNSYKSIMHNKISVQSQRRENLYAIGFYSRSRISVTRFVLLTQLRVSACETIYFRQIVLPSDIKSDKNWISFIFCLSQLKPPFIISRYQKVKMSGVCKSNKKHTSYVSASEDQRYLNVYTQLMRDFRANDMCGKQMC